MSQPGPVTYRFSTFQELFDTVPADRIELCLSEMGKAWAAAKEVISSQISLVQTMAQVEGVTLPEDAIRVKLPEVHEWIDDGKGEITATIRYSDGAEPVWTPFYFESNLFFDHIHNLKDWQRLRNAYPNLTDSQLLEAKEATYGGHRPQEERDTRPNYGFRGEHDGERTLRDFFVKHNMLGFLRLNLPPARTKDHERIRHPGV